MVPRGTQQKRDQDAACREHAVAKRRAVARSEPGCSLVRYWGGRASNKLAKAACAGEQSDRGTSALLRGSRDGTPRQERAERGRPRPTRVATATADARPQAKVHGSDEESEELILPTKAVKAAGGKGLCLMM